MGVPLKEIKVLIDRISPDTTIDVLEKQRLQVREQLRRLKTLEEMIALRIEQIELGRAAAEAPVPPLSVAEIRGYSPVSRQNAELRVERYFK